MKRVLSIFLSLVILITCLFGVSGCSGDTQTVTMGQWLAMINDSFGMESYQEETPYFSHINADDPYFKTVQIATEWGVVSQDEELAVNEPITWRQALVSLVNASNFLPADSSEEQKIDCAIEKFDDTVRKYWANRTMKMADAVLILAKAQNVWANRKYTERIEKISYLDNVVDLSSGSHQMDVLDQTIVVKNADTSVKSGDICVVPSKENSLEKAYIKVNKVDVKNDNEMIIYPSSEEVELEDVYEELKIQDTVYVSAENAVIYDGNGNLLSDGSEISPQSMSASKPEITALGATNKGQAFDECAAVKVKKTFTVSGVEISLSYNLDGKLDMGVEVSSPNILSKDKPGELKVDTGFEVSNLSVTHDFDWGFLSLKSAELKVDYETKTKFGLSYSTKAQAVAAPKYSNGNGKFLTNFKRAVIKGAGGSGAKTIASKKRIKVCSINVYNVGVAKICLDVNLTLSVDGSVEISITESGSKGIEYKKGNIRFIKTNKRDVDAEIKAKVELTLGFGPALYVVGLKKRLIGLEVKVGVGASAALTMHLATSQMHLIEQLDFSDVSPEISAAAAASTSVSAQATDIQAIAAAQGGVFSAEVGAEVLLSTHTCLDIKVYGILSVGLTDESFLVDVVGDKVSLSVSLLNEKNATFLNIHVDDFNWSGAVIKLGKGASKDNCTFKFIPFDAAEKVDEEDAENQNDEIVVGEMLILSTMNLCLSEGQEQLLTISQLPRGYSLEDIVFTVKDKKVAEITSAGIVKAVGPGATIVTATTKDKKYQAMAAIIVTDTYSVDFEQMNIYI